MSSDRLTARAERLMCAAGRPTSWHALDAGDLGVRPDDVEEAGHDVDLDVELAQRTHDAEHVRRRLLREGDDHALDVEQGDELRKPVGRAQDAQVLDLGAARLRLRVDEAHQVDAVLGVLEDLARPAAARRRRPRR